MRVKTLVLLAVLLASAISFYTPFGGYFSIPSVYGWLSGWSYRKSHEIEGSTAGAGTDYQIRIKVHYGSGTDSGEDVYLNEKCRSDFGDVRFTSSDGETLLDYWIEEKVDSDYAIFWVEVDSIPASPDTKTIYIYYGKSDATTTSDGLATFIRWDDFDDGYSVGDAPKSERGWSTSGTTSSDTIEIDNNPDGEGKVVHIHETGDETGTVLYNNFGGVFSNIAIHFKIRISTFSFIVIEENDVQRITTRHLHPSDGDYSKYYDGSAYQDFSPSASITSNTWYSDEWRVYEAGGNWYFYLIRDGTSHEGGFRSTPSEGFDEIWFAIYRFYSGDMYIDQFFIRKYVDPEPSHGAWGSEETAGQESHREN